MSIPVQCYTNLEEYKGERWPDTMACRPIVGDRVESKSGLAILAVRSVMHKQMDVELWESVSATEPVLVVELARWRNNE
jgi:hypothetical protein